MADTPDDHEQRGQGLLTKVLTYQSQVMFDPDMIVEMFVFDSAGERDDRAATADGQLHDDGAGAAAARAGAAACGAAGTPRPVGRRREAWSCRVLSFRGSDQIR